MKNCGILKTTYIQEPNIGRIDFLRVAISNKRNTDENAHLLSKKCKNVSNDY